MSMLSPNAQRAFARMQQVRARLLKSIEKAIKNVGRLSRQSLPDDIVKQIERQINREGWMEKIIEKRFKAQAERSYGRGKWKPLRPSTIKRRGSSRPILIDTSDMLIHTFEAVRGTFRFRDPIKWDIDDIGVEYAQYHMTGTNKMPARRFFLPPDARELEPVYKRAFTIARELLRRRVISGGDNDTISNVAGA